MEQDIYSYPSMWGGELFGARLSRRLALTFTRRMDTLCTRCLITSDSSPPKCLASALPIIFTWATDSASQCFKRDLLEDDACRCWCTQRWCSWSHLGWWQYIWGISRAFWGLGLTQGVWEEIDPDQKKLNVKPMLEFSTLL